MISHNSVPTYIPAVRSSGIRCNYWVEQFAQTDIRFAHQILIGQLAELTSSQVEPIKRLETLETLKESIRFLQGELTKRYCAKPLPLEPGDDAVWNDVISLWQESIRNYQQCLQACREADPAIVTDAAFIVIRCMQQIGSLILDYKLICRSPPGAIWRLLNELYLYAESNGLSSIRVQDRFVHLDPDSSCAEAYAQVLRAHLANPFFRF